MTIPFGAIVLSAFPFTDLSESKRRPCLVVSTDNDRRREIVVAFITSRPRLDRDAVAIESTPTTGLRVASAVRFDKLATISTTIITGRIGTADPVWLASCSKVFFRVFGFDAPSDR